MVKLHWGSKDGGPESKGWMYGIEIKRLFSILVLKFEPGTRDAYHTHAFNAVSWLFSGHLYETLIDGVDTDYYPGVSAIFTGRDTFHQVYSVGRSWAITFRGPWKDSWREFIPATKELISLTHGRQVQ